VPDVKNTSRNLIEVNLINYNIILDIIIDPFFQKINDPDAQLNIVSIFTHPQNWKTTSNSNGNYTEELEKIAELLKGSPIDDEQWTPAEIASEKLQESFKIELEDDLNSPVMTVEELNDTYIGIDWMRLLSGIFSHTNIHIKPHDLVRVPFPNYLLELLNITSNDSKE
jgi:hypothetical protein